MQRLPPLNAVKAFEAATRLGSFALAAAELGVSATAVSQQVRNLETFFGKRLFRRSGNRIVLTDAGHAVFPSVSRALDDIAAVTARMLEGEPRRRLVVSVPFSLAETWLAPKLAALLDLHPRLTLDIRAEDDPVDLGRANIDLRVAYGAFQYPATRAIELMHDEVLPVCAPGLHERLGAVGRDLGEVPDEVLIHTDWGPSFASHPTWSDWFARMGSARRPDPSRGRRAGLSSLALTLARLGLGVALGQRALAAADLEAGRLAALSDHSVPLGHPYCALVPEPKAARAEIAALIGLLRGEA